MITDDIEGLSAAYAVDAVNAVERALFEAHLAGCNQCQTEVDSLRSAATELSSLTTSTPPAPLRAAVLRDIHAVRPLPPKVTPEAAPEPEAAISASPTPPAPASLDSKRDKRARGDHQRRRWLAGIAAAAVLATGGLTWHPWSTGKSPAQLIAMEQLLHAKDVQRFETKASTGTATVLRSVSLNKAIITTTNLLAAPQGKVYEVWLQQGQTMVKAGFISGGPSNTIVFQGNAATATAAAITIEPAGGSPTPTTTPLAQVTFT
ncbi:MAG: anti-sigma factor [Actinomycetota bacterium]